MTDRYTLRVSYTIDMDVEIDRSTESPNNRKTGNVEAIEHVSAAFIPRGAREVQINTMRHLTISHMKSSVAVPVEASPEVSANVS